MPFDSNLHKKNKLLKCPNISDWEVSNKPTLPGTSLYSGPSQGHDFPCSDDETSVPKLNSNKIIAASQQPRLRVEIKDDGLVFSVFCDHSGTYWLDGTGNLLQH